VREQGKRTEARIEWTATRCEWTSVGRTGNKVERTELQDWGERTEARVEIQWQRRGYNLVYIKNR
jgi:hypothetical protein